MCTLSETLYTIRASLWYFVLYWSLALVATFAFNLATAHFRAQRKERKNSHDYFALKDLTGDDS